jgi:hypothetical protein
MSDNGFGPGNPLADAPDTPTPPPVQDDAAAELTPAAARFQSCRWRQVAESGIPEHCTHRDVEPMAGTTGFDPQAWCPDCQHYKVRRQPRKRPAPPTPERYYY